MGAIISYPDYTLTAVNSGGSWLSSLSLASLQNQLLSKKTRSVNALAASTIILSDLGTAKPVRVVGALGHNISFAGTIRIRGYSDSGYTTLVTGADTGTVFVWPQTMTAAECAEYPNNWISTFSSDKTARYWKTEIVDTGNSAGYIELGRRWLGAATFTPAVSMSYGASLGYEPRDISDESLGGVMWGEKRAGRRVCAFSFGNLSNAEKQKSIIMQKVLGSIGETLWIMDSNDTAQDMLLQAFPATIRKANPLTCPYYNNYEMPMEVLEII